MIGAEDKRQITACIASSLDGDLLPMQLIFHGKTNKCHPPVTDAAKDARVHITHSPNHWSSQETMQQYIKEVVVPYADRSGVPKPYNIVLVLDVWSVHKSEEFRKFLRTHHPNIRLVFVPPNCTSKLQVADVVLQRPFKHGLHRRFNEWAANIISRQIEEKDLAGLSPYLKMSSIKPLILQWCVDSWLKMKEGREYIKNGWKTCCTSKFDVLDEKKRQEVVEEVARQEFEAAVVPEQAERDVYNSDAESDNESDHEENEKKDELDIMKERQFGQRKSTRKRKQPSVMGYVVNSSQIALSGESELEI